MPHFLQYPLSQGCHRPQPPRPPRPSLSICCHHSDDPKAAAWALDVSVAIAIHVAIRHNVTFLMTCLILLSRCSGQCTQRRGKRTPALTRYFPMATIQASKCWSTTWEAATELTADCGESCK